MAIFMYVGGEVSIGSSIINFLGQPNVAGMAAMEANNYVSLFWGGMLIGRFMGAVELSEMKKINKQLLLAGIPMFGFVLFWTLRSWNSDQGQFDFAGGWSHREKLSAAAGAVLGVVSIRQSALPGAHC